MLQPFPLILFILVVSAVIICVLKERKLRIPFTSHSFVVDYAIPPLIGVLLLLISGSLSPAQVWKGGVVGDSHIQPYGIIILFNCLAYLCISVDLTGVLAYLAYKVAQFAGSSGKRLFIYFYLLSSVFTVVTSNDIVILTLTPIIFYCCTATKIDPLPYLYGEFLAANILSLVLLIGNPTNIIVGIANDLTFFSYSKYMALVGIVAAASCFGLLYLKFYNQINVTFQPPALDPDNALIDRTGAIFTSITLVLTLVFCTLAPSLEVELWLITLIAMLIVLAHNLYSWPWRVRAWIPADVEMQPVEDKTVADDKQEEIEISSPTAKDSSDGGASSDDNSQMYDVETNSPPTLTTLSIVDLGVPPQQAQTKGGTYKFEKRRQYTGVFRCGGRQFNPNAKDVPTVKRSLLALPWRIIPFVFGMFTLVEGLKEGGWIDEISLLLSNGIKGAGSDDSSGMIFASVFLMTVVTVVLCNLVNNQPATILLTRVVISDIFKSIPPKARSAGMFGVILGSNLGANFTLIGALAGIMYAKILAEKGITMSYLQFLKIGFAVSPIVLICSAGILWLECASFF